MKFKADRWIGNRWASIDIEPVDEGRFLPILTYLIKTYHIALPSIVDTIDGYAADFALAGGQCTMMIDAWSFSIAFENDVTRDRVLAVLHTLPPDFFG